MFHIPPRAFKLPCVKSNTAVGGTSEIAGLTVVTPQCIHRKMGGRNLRHFWGLLAQVLPLLPGCADPAT